MGKQFASSFFFSSKFYNVVWTWLIDFVSLVLIASILNLDKHNTGKSKCNVNNKSPASGAKKASASSKHKVGASGGGGSKKAVKLSASQVKILETLGKLHAAKIEQPTRDLLQTLSGNTKTVEGFKKNMSILKKHGYINYPDGKTVELTSLGLEYVGDSIDTSDLTNEQMQANIKEVLSKAGGRILDAINDGKVHNKDEVAKQLGYDMNKLSGYNKDLSKMSTLGYLDKTSTTIQLKDICFPFGRPE